MGTHPIFESDFDCLTDLNRLQWLHRSQKHSKRSARRTKPNSQNALWRNKTRSAQTFSSDAPSPSALRSTRRSMPSPTVSKSRASGRRRQTATSTCLPSPNSPSSFAFVVSTRCRHVSRRSFNSSDNAVVDNSLGNLGLQCVEDVIHEIFTVGP